MKKSRILAFFLLLNILLTACEKQTKEEQTTTNINTEITTTETVVPGTVVPEPDIPDLDYNGADFTFIMRSMNFTAYKDKYIIAEEEIGEPINDAVFRRNSQTEEKFNLKIKAISPSNGDGWGGEVEAMVRNNIMAGDDEIDVISSMRYTLSALGREGILYDFKDLPYVNLTNAYWDENAAEDISYFGKVFMMPCDISMSNFSNARFMYFNQAIINDYDMDSPFDLVRQNEWTLDKMLDMILEVSEDLNGDGVFDHNDKYGMLTENSAAGTFMNMLTGTGFRMVTKGTDDTLTVNILSDHVATMIDKVRAVLENTDCAISSEEIQKIADITGYSSVYSYTRSLFAQGRYLFYNGGASSYTQFRDMEDDFGIVPNPKLNAEQDEYYHKVDKYSTLFAIPITAPDIERVGAIMEYSSWLSNQLLLPAYYETTLKGKALRDKNSIEMLDLIKNSIIYDFSDLYDLGIDDIVWNAYVKGNLASVYTSNEKRLNKLLEKIYDDFSSIS